MSDQTICSRRNFEPPRVEFIPLGRDVISPEEGEDNYV